MKYAKIFFNGIVISIEEIDKETFGIATDILLNTDIGKKYPWTFCRDNNEPVVYFVVNGYFYPIEKLGNFGHMFEEGDNVEIEIIERN